MEITAIKNNVGMKWEMVRLGDVCDVLGGYAFKSENFKNEGVPLLRISNITDGEVSFKDDCICVEDSNLSNLQRFKVIKGDILLALSGATTGKFGVYKLDYFSFLNQRVGLIRSTEKTNQKYLLYYLNILKSQIEQIAQGAAQPNISTNEISNLQIPLPPLATQKRIAEILDAADALRRKDQALLQKYDELAQAIFMDMFGDPVKNEKGWEVKTIEQLVKKTKHSIKRGPFGGALKKEIFVNDGYLVYEQFHALNNDFTFGRYFIDQEKYNELIAFDVRPKDIIISCSGIYLGKLAIVPEGVKPGIINQALLKLTLDENIYRNEFFVKVFTQDNFKDTYFASERGAAIPNFPPMATFKEFKFICPPIKIQNEYLNLVQNLQNQIEIVSIEQKTSNSLFQTLLQKAFNGALVP